MPLMKLRGLACVLIGTVITIVIAWTQYLANPRVGKLTVHTVDATGALVASEDVGFEEAARFAGRADVRYGGYRMFDLDPPGWWPWVGWECEAYGWPWRGVVNMYTYDEQDPRRLPYLATGLRLRGLRTDPNTGARYERALPIVPSPWGLADVAVWSVAAGAVWWLAARARSARRRRRGLCARCAHSLAGLPDGGPCPECGKSPATGRGGAEPCHRSAARG